MEYNEILNILSPCGLNCKKCIAYTEGEIKFHCNKLKELLGSFDKYAERFSTFMPVFKNYPSFMEMLNHFIHSDCKGCRNGDCKYPNCGVAPCSKNKGVDFCYQCDEFPCERSNFDPDLKERWIQMNSLMKEIGAEAYYEETKDLPRYR